MQLKIIGHRGAKGLIPEHTVASFQAALDAGVDEIECDVRITKDGVPILVHDDSLQAHDGTAYKVSAYTLAELIAQKPDIMTLTDTIKFVNKRVSLQIELKPKEDFRPLLVILKDYMTRGWSPDDFIITSSDYQALGSIHAAAPLLPLSVIQPWSGVLAVYHARKLGTKRISMNEHVMWPYFIRSMARRGWLLSGYTMDNPARAARWATYGLYAVISDYPDRFSSLK